MEVAVAIQRSELDTFGREMYPACVWHAYRPDPDLHVWTQYFWAVYIFFLHCLHYHVFQAQLTSPGTEPLDFDIFSSLPHLPVSC